MAVPVNADDPLTDEQVRAAQRRVASWADRRWPGRVIAATSVTPTLYMPTREALTATDEVLGALGIGPPGAS